MVCGWVVNTGGEVCAKTVRLAALLLTQIAACAPVVEHTLAKNCNPLSANVATRPVVGVLDGAGLRSVSTPLRDESHW